MTLVDSNVLIDVLQDDAEWADWSEAQLVTARARGPLYINAIGYAEIAPAVDSMIALDHFLKRSRISVKPISRRCAYLASNVFLKYEKQKGTKTGVRPDFFIGAHAQTEGWPILTRDARRYGTYFPLVKLISP